MNKLLVACLGLAISIISLAQDKRTFNTQPFSNGSFAIKEGIIELGPEFSWKQSIRGQSILLRPMVRFPLTETAQNSIYIDRYSPTWRGIMAFEYGILNNVECTERNGHSFNLQAEVGYSGFEYYPLFDQVTPDKESLLSYAFEFKFIGFMSSKQLNSRQYSPQFRIRYSKNATPSDAKEYILGTNIMNRILDQPYNVTIISPAMSLQYYPGTGIFTYGGSFFYDYSTSNGSTNEFQSGRLRIEANVFCAPQVRMNYFKIGLTPFLSIRTNGTDKFSTVVYGGQISVRFGTSSLQFF